PQSLSPRVARFPFGTRRQKAESRRQSAGPSAGGIPAPDANDSFESAFCLLPSTPRGPPTMNQNFGDTRRETPNVPLWEMTRRSMREGIDDGRIRAAIIPTGSTEQHNEHLHMIHDTASA